MNALLSQDVHWLVFSPVTGLHFMPTPFAIHGVTPFCVYLLLDWMTDVLGSKFSLFMEVANKMLKS